MIWVLQYEPKKCTHLIINTMMFQNALTSTFFRPYWPIIMECTIL